jgi:hypothetical protein
MTKLSYGFVEAVHYWWHDLTETFKRNGYKVSMKDKWLFIKREGNKPASCGTTVDDCFFVATCDEEWITAQSSMLKDKYHEITVQRGDELGLVGMQVQMKCLRRKRLPVYISTALGAYSRLLPVLLRLFAQPCRLQMMAAIMAPDLSCHLAIVITNARANVLRRPSMTWGVSDQSLEMSTINHVPLGPWLIMYNLLERYV